MDQSQSQKQYVLYANFSTVEQIAKSIDIEKERLDEENIVFLYFSISFLLKG